MVYTEDEALRKRMRDIVAVVAKDLDCVRVDVEDGVAYVEGVVSSAEEANTIVRTIARLRGLRRVVTWLSTETVMDAHTDNKVDDIVPTPVVMHFYSQS